MSHGWLKQDSMIKLIFPNSPAKAGQEDLIVSHAIPAAHNVVMVPTKAQPAPARVVQIHTFPKMRLQSGEPQRTIPRISIIILVHQTRSGKSGSLESCFISC